MTGDEPLFHVKICGVTSPDDAALAADAGADAIGLNFVAGSPRRLDAAAARAVAAAVPPGVLVVGVFAGLPADEIVAIVRTVGLGAVQLHGHLSGAGPAVDPPATPAALQAACGTIPVIRAVRLGATGLMEARGWLAAAAALGAAPAMAIVDAGVPPGAAGAALGGTGARVDWNGLAAESPLGLPWALAGGLDPGNVAAAIRATAARGVDVASGVESAPGRKDPAKVRAFVAAAREAFGEGAGRTPVGG